MLIITNKFFFCEVVADAVAQAHLSCRNRRTRNRWIRAIAKAASVVLQEDTTFLHWEPTQQKLYFWSAESNEIYEIEETCECPAFLQPKRKPCYHRAMRGLLKNYFELIKKPGEGFQIDFADAVFFDPHLSILKKVNLLNLSFNEGRAELIPRITALEKFLPLNLN
ncbi:MAG TPA: hypothetical protein PKY82_00750 [Pyrinomonadaceae bacterium]|nr:hypothetical protein [Pyrinomonadaceae bacterium]